MCLPFCCEGFSLERTLFKLNFPAAKMIYGCLKCSRKRPHTRIKNEFRAFPIEYLIFRCRRYFQIVVEFCVSASLQIANLWTPMKWIINHMLVHCMFSSTYRAPHTNQQKYGGRRDVTFAVSQSQYPYNVFVVVVASAVSTIRISILFVLNWIYRFTLSGALIRFLVTWNRYPQ